MFWVCFFFGCTHGTQKFTGQGLNLCHGGDLSHSSDNTGSLTHWTTRELLFFEWIIFLEVTVAFFRDLNFILFHFWLSEKFQCSIFPSLAAFMYSFFECLQPWGGHCIVFCLITISTFSVYLDFSLHLQDKPLETKDNIWGAALGSFWDLHRNVHQWISHMMKLL